ncbi:PREDICTED: amelogenin-like [Dipodomys ordii]|uniref:Amelogenin-like n=1 Tax=Dipodomys ordii TaxID=10020 RepID=A0A1S3EVT1_DIPOR|nr:PREDICTED: amelogenin-like [Dipodomys ordii]
MWDVWLGRPQPVAALLTCHLEFCHQDLISLTTQPTQHCLSFPQVPGAHGTSPAGVSTSSHPASDGRPSRGLTPETPLHHVLAPVALTHPFLPWLTPLQLPSSCKKQMTSAAATATGLKSSDGHDPAPQKITNRHKPLPCRPLVAFVEATT